MKSNKIRFDSVESYSSPIFFFNCKYVKTFEMQADDFYLLIFLYSGLSTLGEMDSVLKKLTKK